MITKSSVDNRFEKNSTLGKLGGLPTTSFQESSYELLPHPVPRKSQNLKNINKASKKTQANHLPMTKSFKIIIFFSCDNKR